MLSDLMNSVKTADVAKNLTGVFGEAPQVVTFGSDNQVRITTKYKINETGVDDEVETALYNGLKGMVGSRCYKEKISVKIQGKFRNSRTDNCK